MLYYIIALIIFWIVCAVIMIIRYEIYKDGSVAMALTALLAPYCLIMFLNLEAVTHFKLKKLIERERQNND